jgi:putative SOS response-associated peptidase YedK
MCARFTQHHTPAQITERFEPVRLLFEPQPRYNIAPSQIIPVIWRDGNSRVMEGIKWGLIPPWAKSPGTIQPIINARAESLAEKPTFRRPLTRQRCLIPADGFYEWTAGTAGKRQPIHFRLRTQELFAFAGLWDQGRDQEGAATRMCTLITVPPNDLVASVHNRMPAILRVEHESLWLDPELQSPSALIELLKPYPAELMESFPVSPRLNSPRADDPDCLRPAGDGNQTLSLPGL